MALKIVQGAITGIGAATPLAPDTGSTGPTGTSWRFVEFALDKRAALRLERVSADTIFGARIREKQAGRFAFYTFNGELILCGFAGADGIELANATSDPALLAADVIRMPAKRKIFWGVVLIPTIIGLFFAFDMIRAGRATLRAHPAPRRPGEQRLKRALKGQWWLFW